jgi:hypothetical protein
VEHGLIFEKQKGFFAKKKKHCPPNLGRPRKAGDMATMVG